MKRIRPAPMGRAFRYVRRITHIDIALAERGKKDDTLATVVGEEKTGTKTTPNTNKKKTKTRAVAKKFAGKKATTRR
jgi:large subunit ribosomal protein L22